MGSIPTMPNRYPGQCGRCLGHVEPGQGLAYQHLRDDFEYRAPGDRFEWLVICLDLDACRERARVHNPWEFKKLARHGMWPDGDIEYR